MRNKILATALLVVLPFFVTACTLQDLPVIGKYFPGGSSTATTQPFTLKVWGLWESPEALNALVNKYKEKTPNATIDIEDRSIIKLEEYKETVYSRAGQGDAPDVVFVHNSWVPGLRANLAPAPDKVLDAGAYANRFYPVAAASAVADNKVYAVPLYYDGLVLVYNKAHFAEVDQAAAPTAWEEFRKLALDLTIKGTDGTLVRAGAAIGTADNIDFASDILGLMFAQARVGIPADMDSKAAQDALSFYTNFVTEDGVWNTSMPEASAAFSQEKVSMIFVPTWNLLDILRARPDLDIGVAPVPQAIPEEPATWGSFWMVAVPAGSKNKEAAWDFINFITQDDQQLLMFSEASKFRQFGAPYSSVGLKSQLDENDYLKPLLDTAPFAKSERLAARSGNKGAVEAVKEAINDMLRVGRPDVALKTAKDKVINTK